MVLSTNDTWDELSQRTASIIRRLRHTTNVVDDFRATREGLLVWLSDLENQMDDVTHTLGTCTMKLEQLRVGNVAVLGEYFRTIFIPSADTA